MRAIACAHPKRDDANTPDATQARYGSAPRINNVNENDRPASAGAGPGVRVRVSGSGTIYQHTRDPTFPSVKYYPAAAGHSHRHTPHAISLYVLAAAQERETAQATAHAAGHTTRADRPSDRRPLAIAHRPKPIWATRRASNGRAREHSYVGRWRPAIW